MANFNASRSFGNMYEEDIQQIMDELDGAHQQDLVTAQQPVRLIPS